MRWLGTFTTMLLTCCAGGAGPAVAPGPPAPEVVLSAPWQVVSRSPNGIVVRLGEGAEGVRIVLAPDEDGRLPGVSPIVGGRTLELREPTGVLPLLAVPYADRPLGPVRVRGEGPDVVVDLPGPPMNELTEDPLAPDVPLPLRVRLRPRPTGWRIVADGLVDVNLPAPVAVRPTEAGFLLVGEETSIEVTTTAPRHASRITAGRWHLSLAPSLDARQTAPRTTITWRARER